MRMYIPIGVDVSLIHLCEVLLFHYNKKLLYHQNYNLTIVGKIIAEYNKKNSNELSKVN